MVVETNLTVSNLSLYISGLQKKLTNKLDLPLLTDPINNIKEGIWGKFSCRPSNFVSGGASFTLKIVGALLIILYYIFIF